VTIDATKPNRALDNARTAFLQAANHDTLQAAINNLLHCLPNNAAKRVMMIGHGHSGLIITGSGEFVNGQNRSISLGNMFVWQSELPKLKDDIAELIFFSCDTAATPYGPRFLVRVAQKVKKRVHGFTGLLFIDDQGNISCETSGEWLHADPTDPLPPRAPSLRLVKITSMEINLKDGGRVRTFQVSQISEFRYFDSATRKDAPRLYLKGEQAQILASMVNFAELSEESGAPLALVTGVIDLQFEKEDAPRSFTVYNDRLLQDQSAPEVFYFASPEFSAALSESRSFL